MNFDRAIEVITPAWPIGFDHWETLVTLVIIGLFKLDRGTVMFQRAVTIDRLGWSIIIFDWIMGATFLLSVTWSLYPETRVDPWIPRIAISALMVAAIWQWAEMRFASTDRVEMVAAGTTNGQTWDGLAEHRGFVRRETELQRVETDHQRQETEYQRIETDLQRIETDKQTIIQEAIDT